MSAATAQCKEKHQRSRAMARGYCHLPLSLAEAVGRAEQSIIACVILIAFFFFEDGSVICFLPPVCFVFLCWDEKQNRQKYYLSEFKVAAEKSLNNNN